MLLISSEYFPLPYHRCSVASSTFMSFALNFYKIRIAPHRDHITEMKESVRGKMSAVSMGSKWTHIQEVNDEIKLMTNSSWTAVVPRVWAIGSSSEVAEEWIGPPSSWFRAGWKSHPYRHGVVTCYFRALLAAEKCRQAPKALETRDLPIVTSEIRR